MKFCGECGSALQYLCPQCGFKNPPRFKFCGACGTSLTGQASTPSPVQEEPSIQVEPPTEPPTPDAERRQLTVMFCDLVDSTKLSSQFDPEDYREVVRAYQSACTEVIQRFDGHIAQLLGDGLLVYFGYPQAFYEAEVYRLKGALLLQQSSDNQPEAATCFQQAMTIAQNQSAKSWELRAATSLAKLWQSQGKRKEAYDLLAPVYGWFTEGFDTLDLKDAKALLEELA